MSPLEFYGEGAAFTISALNADLTVQDIHHTFHQSQAEAVSLGGVGGIALIEFFKNMYADFGLDSAAGVPDGYDHPITFFFQADANGTAFRCEFHGIGNEIVPYECQQLRIRTDPGVFRDLSFNMEVFLFPDILKLQKALTKLVSEVKFSRLGKNLLIFQLVQLENVGDERCELSGSR